MMRSAFGRLVPFTLLFLITACGSGNGDNVTPSSPTAPSAQPSPSTCTASTSGVPAQVTSRGGTFAINVTTASNCTWTARTDVQWASVSPGSGSGNATLALQISETAQNDSRTLTLTVNTQTYRVVQEGVRCVYTLDIPTLQFVNDGGLVEFGLTTSAGCSWAVTTGESWITVVTPNGVGSGTIRLNIARNTGPVRQGVVTIAGQQVTFTQARG